MSKATRFLFSSKETFENPPKFKQKSYSENKIRSPIGTNGAP